MKDLVRRAYAYLREKFPPNRVVALLTPLAASAAGFVATWVAAHFPGLPPIDSAWLGAIFVAGAGAAVAAAYKWLDGWQRYEDQIHDAIMDNRIAERDQGASATTLRARRR